MSDREITLLLSDEMIGALALARRVLALATPDGNIAARRIAAVLLALDRCCRDGASLTVRVARSPPAGPESG